MLASPRVRMAPMLQSQERKSIMPIGLDLRDNAAVTVRRVPLMDARALSPVMTGWIPSTILPKPVAPPSTTGSRKSFVSPRPLGRIMATPITIIPSKERTFAFKIAPRVRTTSVVVLPLTWVLVCIKLSSPAAPQVLDGLPKTSVSKFPRLCRVLMNGTLAGSSTSVLRTVPQARALNVEVLPRHGTISLAVQVPVALSPPLLGRNVKTVSSPRLGM
jgi:hypothetical protein